MKDFVNIFLRRFARLVSIAWIAVGFVAALLLACVVVAIAIDVYYGNTEGVKQILSVICSKK